MMTTGKAAAFATAGARRATVRAAACVVVCVAVGAASASIRRPDRGCDALVTPAWMPPGWAFGLVGVVSYAAMGVALSLVLARGWRSPGVRGATTAFAVQLALNAAWSSAFFGLRSPETALLIMVALWLAIGWTVAAFWSVRDVAAVLLTPYWAAATFAVTLNAAIWRMN